MQFCEAILAAGDGAFMEPSGSSRWQSEVPPVRVDARPRTRLYSKAWKKVGKVPTSPSTMSTALQIVIDRSGGFERRHSV
jgi:hypothetical protein